MPLSAISVSLRYDWARHFAAVSLALLRSNEPRRPSLVSLAPHITPNPLRRWLPHPYQASACPKRGIEFACRLSSRLRPRAVSSRRQVQGTCRTCPISQQNFARFVDSLRRFPGAAPTRCTLGERIPLAPFMANTVPAKPYPSLPFEQYCHKFICARGCSPTARWFGCRLCGGARLISDVVGNPLGDTTKEVRLARGEVVRFWR